MFADKQKIQQVFLNLLKNSIDVLEGKGIIQIRAEQDDTQLKIIISDNGPGIPKQIQERIFDPFFSTKEIGQGVGLGLFIVHDIISQHNGMIHAKNNDKGAAFTIMLPIKENG
ncbi:MAG: ATP-binding protein [Candidatus Electrothrix sp. AR3]|nr:ATP-binding protein [Candidatus Electrothrix sp. AR3]